MYILILITYFGGYASGAQTTMQEFSSAESCEFAKAKALSMVDDLNKLNSQTWRSAQKSASAECVKK